MYNIWLHVKSGRLYMVLTHKALGTETQEELTVYLNTEGAYFVRPTAMFLDGRFTRTDETQERFEAQL